MRFWTSKIIVKGSADRPEDLSSSPHGGRREPTLSSHLTTHSVAYAHNKC